MARSIWKGAISFGLVHIPVALQSATSSDNLDFDWLDQRTMDPVGYKRVNKVTGKEVTKENIVKGIQYEKGKYILLSEEEIKSAHPKSTQTIEIFSFVDSSDIPLTNIETPYYLAPDKRGEKVYALLRETLVETKAVGLASVILHTKQHLAAVMPLESALVLILLRWPSEVRGLDTLELTSATTDATLSKAEKDMAKRLVEDMKSKWEPKEYRDTFQEKIMALVDTKVAEGKIEDVETETDEEPRKSADIIDLTELLKRSLGGGKKTAKIADKKTSTSETVRAKKTSSAKPVAKPATSKTTTKKSEDSKPKRTPKKASSK
jgi:DNA end-binding protein Ku